MKHNNKYLVNEENKLPYAIIMNKKHNNDYVSGILLSPSSGANMTKNSVLLTELLLVSQYYVCHMQAGM